jgi:thiol:disulfide interchange protein
MKKIITLSLFFFLLPFMMFGQFHDPVKWKFDSKKINANEFELLFTAEIDKEWYIYGLATYENEGPLPTSFHFEDHKSYSKTGSVKEVSKVVKKLEPAFGDDVFVFSMKGPAVFSQKVKLKEGKATVKGFLEYMTCNLITGMCLPPEEVDFSFSLTTEAVKTGNIDIEPKVEDTPVIKTDNLPVQKGDNTGSSENPASFNKSKKEVKQQGIFELKNAEPFTGPVKSLWGIFIAGLVGGVLALLTPCVFPMIPLTVSFFTKQSKSRTKGITRAAIYGLSIIGIYVALGFGITKILGPSALNEMASNAVFNLIFFILFVIFAISFFGAFEITLPSKWVNKVDAQSDRGGLIGIFFMAFTLALVSFSCTGPIIGTLLVEAAVGGGQSGPLMGMLGFSVALAIPFTVFAIFPSWLQSLPKSGGWLNSVKVVLGFLELALALKFLSNVDLAYHWNLLDREVFLVIWIVIFGMLGFYLLGKLKFSHDSELKHLTIPRLFLAILAFSFTLYMIPGLWGAPLKSISAWLPPQASQDFDLSKQYYMQYTNTNSNEGKIVEKKYAELFKSKSPHGVNAFYDFEEGLEYAQRIGKPVLVDFTGHACVNCRKMEAAVWSHPDVLQRLQQDYVVISLYVDDRTKLSEDEQFVSPTSGKNIRTIGAKWSDLQTSVFKTNAQPYYVLLDYEGNMLAESRGYDENIPAYVAWLEEGKERYNELYENRVQAQNTNY